MVGKWGGGNVNCCTKKRKEKEGGNVSIRIQKSSESKSTPVRLVPKLKSSQPTRPKRPHG